MEKLIADIEQDALHTAFMTGVKHIDPRVLQAIKAIDRRNYIKVDDREHAYENRPLEIGYGQTISQPFIVALMLHLIEPKPTDTILEVGSGCGYLAAILSKLCHQVFGIEVIKDLAECSKKNLARDHITNITIVTGDGTLGLPEHAPFDKIIVSAAANKLPTCLLDQLSVSGLLILPKNASFLEQTLVKIKKLSDAEFTVTDILPVRLVPLVNS